MAISGAVWVAAGAKLLSAPPNGQFSVGVNTARGQLFLIEVNDFHFGLLPNELAGVHEGAVPLASQAIVVTISSQ